MHLARHNGPRDQKFEQAFANPAWVCRISGCEHMPERIDRSDLVRCGIFSGRTICNSDSHVQPPVTIDDVIP
jgi:hypothetical protein